MRCKDCPLKAQAIEGDKVSFYCRVNSLSVTPQLPPTEAEGALDQECQAGDDFPVFVRPYVRRAKAQILNQNARLHRMLAENEERLAAVEALQAEVE